MLTTTPLKLLGLIAATAFLPTTLAAKPYMDNCSFMEFHTNDGHAIFCCDTDTKWGGGMGYKQSRNSINLSNFIANDAGSLVWRDYGNFADSCDSCHISKWGENMDCYCKTGYWKDWWGWEKKFTQLDPWLYILNDRLTNENGHIKCNDNHDFDGVIISPLAC